VSFQTIVWSVKEGIIDPSLGLRRHSTACTTGGIVTSTGLGLKPCATSRRQRNLPVTHWQETVGVRSDSSIPASLAEETATQAEKLFGEL
jgi:hypothetical protein